MKVKAIIFRPDHKNDVVLLGRRKIEGKTFRHDKNQYFFHADRFQITWAYRPVWPFKTNYITYYYTQGHPYPLPVPDFGRVEETVLDENGSVVYENVLDDRGKPVLDKAKKPVVRPKKIQVFPRVVDLGIPAEELAAIFTPWFYRTIAPSLRTIWDNILFYGVVGACLGIVYLIWGLSTGAFQTMPALPPTPTPTPGA